MNDMDIQDFVTRFAAAWAARDGEAFLVLWHPDGVLHSPLYNRPVAGKEFGRLTELVRESGARSRLAAARLDGARRRRGRRMADDAHRRRAADRLAGRRQVPPARWTHRRGAGLHGYGSPQGGAQRRVAGAADPAGLICAVSAAGAFAVQRVRMCDGLRGGVYAVGPCNPLGREIENDQTAAPGSCPHLGA